MPDGETARALLAGWVSGAAVAFTTTALLLVALARNPGWRVRFQQTSLRLPLVVVIVVNAMMLLWTLVGLLLGALYLGTGQPTFTITVVAIGGLATLLDATVRGVPGWLTLTTIAVALASFGGLLPALVALGEA